MKIKTHRYYLYVLMKTGLHIVSIFPAKFVSKFGELAGKIAYYISSNERKTAIENLSFAFPEKSKKEIRNIAKKVFSNLIRNYAEFTQIWKMNSKNIHLWVKPGKGADRLQNLLVKGKGGIGVGSHFGNWEMMIQYATIKGVNVSTVVKDIYFYRYNKLIKKLRERKTIKTIDRNAHPKKILKVLRDNAIIGILADQDIDSVQGVFVDFFGKKAYTPIAPIRLAITTGAPFAITVLLKIGKRYEFIVEEPTYIEKNKPKQELLTEYTQLWSTKLEKYIRKYPDQWVWMHKRWKTRP